MKKLFVSLMTALLIGTSFVSFAATSNGSVPLETAVYVRTQSMKLDIITQASNDSHVTISLRDASGNTFFRKQVNKSDKASLSRFDLSNLEDGVYNVEISDGTSRQVKSFTIQTTPPKDTSLRSISLS